MTGSAGHVAYQLTTATRRPCSPRMVHNGLTRRRHAVTGTWEPPRRVPAETSSCSNPHCGSALDAAGEPGNRELGEAEHAVYARVRAGRHRGPQDRRLRGHGRGERRAHAAFDHSRQVGQSPLIEQWVDATPVRTVDGEEKDGAAKRRHARRHGLDAGSRRGRAAPLGGGQREGEASAGRARNGQQERDGGALAAREVRGEPREAESDTTGGEHHAKYREQLFRRLALAAGPSACRNPGRAQQDDPDRCGGEVRGGRCRTAQRRCVTIVGASERASPAALERDRRQPGAGEGRRVRPRSATMRRSADRRAAARRRRSRCRPPRR